VVIIYILYYLCGLALASAYWDCTLRDDESKSSLLKVWTWIILVFTWPCPIVYLATRLMIQKIK